MNDKTWSRHSKPALAILLGLATCAFQTAQAAQWSDTYIGYRYGTKFAEPFGSNDIHKNIVNLSHVSGYKYGTNFFNVDLLMSDSKDPSNPTTTTGAQEAYVVYRNTVSLNKVTGKDYKVGIIKDFGATIGFDWNTKDDAGYNSKKHMLVFGPTIMLDVPGFLNISLLELWESNAPCNEYAGTCVSRYNYDPHPMLTAAWGIPIGSSKFSFEGFANIIASKGNNEFGGGTKPEINVDMQVMYDLSGAIADSPGTLKVGLEYQYWRNKFGNDHTIPSPAGAGSGAFAKTPMVRAEYHF